MKPRFLRIPLMRSCASLIFSSALLACAISISAAEVTLSSPGFNASRMDNQGRLLEDWGAVAIKVSGANPTEPKLQAIKLDDLVPAAECAWRAGAVDVTLNAFRAPAWPAGLDVLTVSLREISNRETTAEVAIDLPANVRIGSRTATIGGRTVMTLPARGETSQEKREWGWHDDAVSLPGWARPSEPCDPAFKNIRAGMGGVPILYNFKVVPKAAHAVVLGFCESHWAQAGRRPLLCHVEGADPQEIDPVATWGQHKPGALQFAASDLNGDGQLEIAVVTKPGAPDENPILNAVWVFPANTRLDLGQVIAGNMNAMANYSVDVGGSNDQSLFAGGKLQYAIKLAPGTTEELTFLVASPGGSVPPPDRSAWTPEKLRKTAADVWREWAQR